MPADEAYEAELEVGGAPAKLRLVSEWRREIEASAAARAVAIVRSSPSFQEVVAQGLVPSARSGRPGGGRVGAAL